MQFHDLDVDECWTLLAQRLATHRYDDLYTVDMALRQWRYALFKDAIATDAERVTCPGCQRRVAVVWHDCCLYCDNCAQPRAGAALLARFVGGRTGQMVPRGLSCEKTH